MSIVLIKCTSFCITGEKYYDPNQLSNCWNDWRRKWSQPSLKGEVVHQQLEKNCKQAGVEIRHNTPKDGNCFFHAVSDQLQRLENWHVTAEDLRGKVVGFMKNKPNLQVRKIFCMVPCTCIISSFICIRELVL